MTGKISMIRSMMTSLAAAGAASLMVAAPVFAAGAKVEEPKEVEFHFEGPFGTYDPHAMQRGYQVYETVCSNCHSLNFVAFRNLGDKGGPFHLNECPEGMPASMDCSNPNQNPIVKSIASKYKYQVTDGPDETGEMFQRPAAASDPVPSPFRNEVQARMANNGALPPDLSLIMKARHHGPAYVYSLLTGYQAAPDTVTLAPGQHYNPYFPGDMSQLLKEQYRDAEGHPLEGVEIPHGGVLAMAPPLSDGIVDYVDEETPETVDQYARDVVEFLAWAAEPKMEARKKLGVMTIAYLLILAGVLYWSYREVWSKTEH